MAKAKYYIYRNLHKNCFSVKYKGKVIAHLEELYAYNATFKVSEAGRQRVLATKTKNVHAYVVCESYDSTNIVLNNELTTRVRYNPYHGDSFVTEYGCVLDQSSYVKLKDGKIWI